MREVESTLKASLEAKDKGESRQIAETKVCLVRNEEYLRVLLLAA